MLNTYALYTVAPEVEAVLGHWTFLSVYLLSGLAGSSAAFVFGDTITVGASTCIFGLIGKNRKEVYTCWCQFSEKPSIMLGCSVPSRNFSLTLSDNTSTVSLELSAEGQCWYYGTHCL